MSPSSPVAKRVDVGLGLGLNHWLGSVRLLVRIKFKPLLRQRFRLKIRPSPKPSFRLFLRP